MVRPHSRPRAPPFTTVSHLRAIYARRPRCISVILPGRDEKTEPWSSLLFLRPRALSHCRFTRPARCCVQLQGNPGGATTTGPDATPPPAICQNLGGGGGAVGGGSSRGSGGSSRGRGGGVFLPGVGGVLAGGQGGVQLGVRGGGG